MVSSACCREEEMELLAVCAMVVQPGFEEGLQADHVVLEGLQVNVHAQD